MDEQKPIAGDLYRLDNWGDRYDCIILELVALAKDPDQQDSLFKSYRAEQQGIFEDLTGGGMWGIDNLIKLSPLELLALVAEEEDEDF